MAGDLTLASAGNAISGIGNLDARTISLASSLPLSISGSLRANELWLDAPQGASVTGSVEAAAFARIAAGTTLTVGGGATAGTLDADTVVQGTLVFNRSDSVAFDGALGGAGQLVQRGAGKLLFDGELKYLRTALGSHRRLKLEFGTDPGPITLKTAQLVTDEGAAKHFLLESEQTSILDVLTELGSGHDLTDIKLEEPDIEEVIRTFYQNKPVLAGARP